jgi:protein SCO1
VRTMRRCAALLLACALLAACDHLSASGWHAKDVTGLLPDLAFTMTDDHGRSVDARDYRGRVVLLYFGYTHCPDVCPTTLAKLARAVREMGKAGEDVRVLFVSVDPARDTTDVLAQYAQAFGPAMVGLRGDPDQLDRLTRRYRVSYRLGKPDASGDYDVTHSSGVFAFDRQGRARLLVLPDDALPGLVADLARLAAGG